MASGRKIKSPQLVSNWPNSHVPRPTLAESTITASGHEECLDQVTINELQQGELYILKIKLIVIALFQGWHDDMCCFSVLRTDMLEELRWSEARYLPNNFDAYLAFDYAGNPPIHLWTKQLRAVIPINWFNIFEEARHMQRQWDNSYWDPEPHAVELVADNHNLNLPVDANDGLEMKETSQVNQGDHQEEQGSIELSDSSSRTPEPSEKDLLASRIPTKLDSPLTQPTVKESTSAMRIQDLYVRSTFDVPQQQQHQQTKPESNSSKSEITQRAILPRPDIKHRRSFSSFFMKKRKSKKSSNENKTTKRKSTSPDLQTTKQQPPHYHHNTSIANLHSRKKRDEIEVMASIQSNQSDTSDQAASSMSSPTIQTPQNDAIDADSTNKAEIFDVESYFDMQTTFAFLNNTNTDNFSLMHVSDRAK